MSVVTQYNLRLVNPRVELHAMACTGLRRAARLRRLRGECVRVYMGVRVYVGGWARACACVKVDMDR